MATTDDLTLRMRAQGARQASRDVDRTSRSVKGLGKSSGIAFRSVTKFGGGLRAITGGALAFAAAGTAMAVVLGKQAVGEFREAQKAGNQTAAVLKSMGATSWTSSKQIGDLANSISVKAGVDDEAIQSAENLLLTFGKIRNETGKNNDIFNRATAAAVDLSAAGFGSMDSTAKQLGKALNDPVKGITALNKSGVTFTQKQKDTIKGLVAQNKTLDAQKIIMREVERQVKGSAAAQADPIDKLTVAWNNMLEVAGKPIWGIVTAGINRVIGPLQHVSSVASDVFDDKNLNWSQKFQAIGRSIRHWFGPIANDMIAGLRGAHLDQKLNGVIRAASPQISAAFRTVAPIAASAFVSGFKAAPVWAKLLTAAFLIAKLVPVMALAGAPVGAALGAAIGPAIVTAMVLYLNKGDVRRTLEQALNPMSNPHNPNTPKTTPGTPGSVPGATNVHGKHIESIPLPDPGPTGGGAGITPPPIIDLHNHVHLDGKEVSHSVTRHATKRNSTR